MSARLIALALALLPACISLTFDDRAAHRFPTLLVEPDRSTRVERCSLRVGDERGEVLEDCGAPACRLDADRWVYPSARFDGAARARYAIVRFSGDRVATIEACATPRCCSAERR